MPNSNLLLFISAATMLALLYGWWSMRDQGEKTLSLPDNEEEAQPGSYGIEGDYEAMMASSAYRTTLSNLGKSPHRTTVTFDENGLHFSHYAFEPASIYPDGTITAAEVAEINLTPCPQVRLHQGEILFVPATDKDALLRFVYQEELPVRDRKAIWTSLLDPFLDTWEEQSTIDRQFAWFNSLGLSRETIDQWRREVGPAMLAYNFGTCLWEWGILDLQDVLTAQQAALDKDAFADFYRRAIQLAALDPTSTTGNGMSDSLDGALFSVLLDWFPSKESGSIKNWQKEHEVRSQQIDRMKTELRDQLTQAYSEPQRHYHTLSHIETCLNLLGEYWPHATQLNEVRWAILFHDAIYDPLRNDNEEKSAEWACRIMAELQRPDEERARVREMILATAHHAEPRTADEALLLDIDLSVLGAEPARFDAYNSAIRAEYASVPDTIYRDGRAKVLTGFLQRERIYHTTPFRQQFEETARQNIKKALTAT